MNPEDNPFIKPENYFSGYQDEVEKLRNNPSFIEFDKLCYEVFGKTEDGARLLEYLTERFILPANPFPVGNPAYPNACVYYEGFRDAYRQLVHCVRSYKERKDAEANRELSKEGV